MKIRKLNARGTGAIAAVAVAIAVLSALVVLVPGAGSSTTAAAQAGPVPGGPTGPAGSAASSTPAAPQTVEIIPLIPTDGVAGQDSSNVPLPPPPPTVPYGSGPMPSGFAQGSDCPSYDGQDAAKASVAAALQSAGATARDFTYRNAAGQNQTVLISIPLVLMEAEAWQESGWQSQIVSCDGGYGTMQIMSGTAAWMNSHFAVSYDYHTLSGNTQIGAEYLEWLIAWFGENYYGDDFSLNNQGLLNDVISAYNTGPGRVNPSAAGGGIPNPTYVADVEDLERTQPWSR
ncbi:MAG TPA: lytic transglycosylase domain-containing protein [Actinocrinis sp.]|nr:lytic transglycosylase domain-containing protein [Actinocrinis sp.]